MPNFQIEIVPLAQFEKKYAFIPYLPMDVDIGDVGTGSVLPSVVTTEYFVVGDIDDCENRVCYQAMNVIDADTESVSFNVLVDGALSFDAFTFYVSSSFSEVFSDNGLVKITLDRNTEGEERSFRLFVKHKADSESFSSMDFVQEPVVYDINIKSVDGQTLPVQTDAYTLTFNRFPVNGNEESLIDFQIDGGFGNFTYTIDEHAVIGTFELTPEIMFDSVPENVTEDDALFPPYIHVGGIFYHKLEKWNYDNGFMVYVYVRVNAVLKDDTLNTYCVWKKVACDKGVKIQRKGDTSLLLINYGQVFLYDEACYRITVRHSVKPDRKCVVDVRFV